MSKPAALFQPAKTAPQAATLGGDAAGLGRQAAWDRLLKLVLRLTVSAVCVGLLAASSRVSVPFFPVPLTLQTLAVLLVGAALGPVWGASTVFSYLAVGLMGAPVFHSGLGGPGILFGPTGGYLVAFIPAAYLIGLAVAGVRRAGLLATWRGLLILCAGALAASVAVYAIGVPWLSLFPGMGIHRAVVVGMTPFVLGDVLKAAVAIGAVRSGASLWRRMGGGSIGGSLF